MTTTVSGPSIAKGGNVFYLKMVRHSDNTPESLIGCSLSFFPGTYTSLFVHSICKLLLACSSCLVSLVSKETPLNNNTATARKRFYSDTSKSVFGSHF